MYCVMFTTFERVEGLSCSVTCLFWRSVASLCKLIAFIFPARLVGAVNCQVPRPVHVILHTRLYLVSTFRVCKCH